MSKLTHKQRIAVESIVMPYAYQGTMALEDLVTKMRWTHLDALLGEILDPKARQGAYRDAIKLRTVARLTIREAKP